MGERSVSPATIHRALSESEPFTTVEQKIATVRIRIEEISPLVVSAYHLGLPEDRAWWFLDYPGFSMGRKRWAVVARRKHEDFQLVTPFSLGTTWEGALDLIHKEVEMARIAIAEIRSVVASERIR